MAKYYLYDPASRPVAVPHQNGNWLREESFAPGIFLGNFDAGRHIAAVYRRGPLRGCATPFAKAGETAYPDDDD